MKRSDGKTTTNKRTTNKRTNKYIKYIKYTGLTFRYCGSSPGSCTSYPKMTIDWIESHQNDMIQTFLVPNWRVKPIIWLKLMVNVGKYHTWILYVLGSKLPLFHQPKSVGVYIPIIIRIPYSFGGMSLSPR